MTGPRQQPDVLIVGGGLAGAAAAVVLAQAGRAVTLLEREGAPKHKVCGEFLSGEALHLLATLGIQPAEHGAVSISTVRLCSAHSVSEARLPFPAMSLTRRCLDALLLETAERAGAQVLRGVAVESLARDGPGWQALLNTGDDLRAPAAILATGKHDLRSFARPRGVQGDLVALKMYWRLSPGQASELDGSVELLLHPHGYSGLQPVEGGIANLCCLVQRDRLASIGGWQGLLAEIRETCPPARLRLAGAEALLPRPLAVSAIPYGFVRRQAAGRQLWAVGDQAAVIPSFTGDGMSIALYTGLRAAESILKGESSPHFQRNLHSTLRWQVTRATAISRALVNRPLGRILVAAASAWPGLLREAARATRLPKFPGA